MAPNTTSPLTSSTVLVDHEVTAADLQVGMVVDLDGATNGVRITEVRRLGRYLVQVDFKTTWFAFDFTRRIPADQVVTVHQELDLDNLVTLKDKLAEMAY